MANILIVGGGFGGVVAAEYLARQIPKEHQITLVSRSSTFIFYPELVRLAFGKCAPDDVSFDLREAMLDRRVRFIEGEVARIKPSSRKVVLAHGEVRGELPSGWPGIRKIYFVRFLFAERFKAIQKGNVRFDVLSPRRNIVLTRVRCFWESIWPCPTVA